MKNKRDSSSGGIDEKIMSQEYPLDWSQSKIILAIGDNDYY